MLDLTPEVLKASLNGDCYMGEAWEKETVNMILAAAPEVTP